MSAKVYPGTIKRQKTAFWVRRYSSSAYTPVYDTILDAVVRADEINGCANA